MAGLASDYSYCLYFADGDNSGSYVHGLLSYTERTAYTHRPPSTSKATPVMNCPSSPDIYKQALAISCGVLDLPRGTVATNPASEFLPRNFELLREKYELATGFWWAEKILSADLQSSSSSKNRTYRVESDAFWTILHCHGLGSIDDSCFWCIVPLEN